MNKILVLNGSNLNLLGKRQPEIYGNKSLIDYQNEMLDFAEKENFDVCFDFYQSNCEGKLIEAIHYTKADYLIANFGGYTHTSVSLRDAVLGVGIKLLEVHISNIKKREEFRQFSYFSDIAEKTIYGDNCYIEALSFVISELKKASE